jgi:hypothetical protein
MSLSSIIVATNAILLMREGRRLEQLDPTPAAATPHAPTLAHQ